MEKSGKPMSESNGFGKRMKSMLNVDFKRMFTMPLVYIVTGVCLVMPVLILIMTTMMSGNSDPAAGEGAAITAFTNVWQSFGQISGDGAAMMSMDLTGMCNVNLLYFLVTVLVCLFISDDFRSGYAKNLFTVRAKKTDYVISKTLVGFVCGTIMVVAYLIGAMIGGAIAGLPFDAGSAGAGGIVMCILSKIFLMSVFVAIDVVAAAAAKQRAWLSILCALAVSVLLFAMIPMITPLDSSFLNVAMCFVGGGLFCFGLGTVSNLILKKTSLV